MYIWYLGGGVGHLEQFPSASNDDGVAYEYEAEAEDGLDTGGVERSAGNQENEEGEDGEEGEDEEGEGKDEEGRGNEDVDPGGSSDEDAGNAY